MKTEVIDINSYENESTENSLIRVPESRAIAEIQAQYIIAKKFPRDEQSSYVRIMRACERPFLAEQAMYAYPRGGQQVRGPSIRLAESMAQAWGNIDYGIKEINRTNDSSVAEAYAIDLELNLKVSKIFHIPLYRETKHGRKLLIDSRDVYELIANQGARRLRACILGILPGDIVDAAVEQCTKTLKQNEESSDIPIADRIRNLVLAFDGLGVKKEHLEKYLGHDINSIIVEEIITLKGIYKSLRDGMADRSQFFDITNQDIILKGETQTEKLLHLLNSRKQNNINSEKTQ
jgi:hypothetical protein